jgi:formamidopyrimidine-DNA glycosylase
MPELPEIATLARQLNQHLAGKQIGAIEILQPKCLNVTEDAFHAALNGARVDGATHHGKWIQVHTDRGWLLLNLGMGGEILLAAPDALPSKRRLVFAFTDQTCLSVNFWWFGYAHYMAEGELAQHPQVGRLGPNALEVDTPQGDTEADAARLKEMLKGQRGAVKAFLLDQERIAGIGNAYIHDILWLARLHPLRKIPTLSEAEIEGLARAIDQGLRPSFELGGAFYEMDIHGVKGGFTFEQIRVGYREGQPCPNCATPITKIKTGGTSSFICPVCQV